MLECQYLVLGSGQTGLYLAKELARQNFEVILVEQVRLGGSYIHTLDIPRDFLVGQANDFATSLKIFKDQPNTFSVLVKHRQKLTEKVVQQIQNCELKQLEELKTMPNLRLVYGQAEFASKTLVEVNSNTERHLITFQKCLICTGKNELISPQIEGLSQVGFLHQHNVFMLDNIPSRLAVIGFTARNLEVASLYANLGIKVEIFEAKPVQQCIKAMDRTALNYLMKKMMSKQVEFYFQTRVVKVDKKRSSSMIKLTLQGGKLGEEEVREFSHCFIWANEVFNPSQLKLKTVNLKSTVRGIVTDKTGRTNQKNIFAFGEASAYTTEGSKLAMLNEFVRAELPKAKAQEYDSIYPIISSFSWIRSNPDILTIGMTEIEAIAKFGPQIKSKLVQLDSVEGFVKVSFKNTNEQIVSIVLAGEMAKRLNTLAFFAIERNVAVKDFLGYLKTVLA